MVMHHTCLKRMLLNKSCYLVRRGQFKMDYETRYGRKFFIENLDYASYTNKIVTPLKRL